MSVISSLRRCLFLGLNKDRNLGEEEKGSWGKSRDLCGKMNSVHEGPRTPRILNSFVRDLSVIFCSSYIFFEDP